MKRASLQEYARGLGLTSYVSSTNTLTSNDIALALQKLYNRELINDENTKLLLSYMERANRREYLMASIPSGIKNYHKAGWLEDRAHDASIIDDGSQPYVLVVFTKSRGPYNHAKGKQVFQAISTSAVSTFINKSGLASAAN